jgi:hypothetical protein
MIAAQKAEALASLAQGEDTDAAGAAAIPEYQLIELAGYVNSRTNVIAGLAFLLAISVVTNLLFVFLR